MSGPDPELQVIPAEECYVLLATQQIGRLGERTDTAPTTP
jgi:hypothetical protein